MLENIPAIAFIIFIVMLGIIIIDISSKSKERFYLRKQCDYVNRNNKFTNKEKNIYNKNHSSFYWGNN